MTTFSPGAMSPEVAAANIAAAEKVLADAKEAEVKAAEAATKRAESGESGTRPAERDIEVMRYGAKMTIKGRNRCWQEIFDDMVSRFLGGVDARGVKIPGELESSDPATAAHAKEMLAIMAIASGNGYSPVPGDVVASNPEDLN